MRGGGLYLGGAERRSLAKKVKVDENIFDPYREFQVGWWGNVWSSSEDIVAADESGGFEQHVYMVDAMHVVRRWESVDASRLWDW